MADRHADVMIRDVEDQDVFEIWVDGRQDDIKIAIKRVKGVLQVERSLGFCYTVWVDPRYEMGEVQLEVKRLFVPEPDGSGLAVLKELGHEDTDETETDS